MIFSYSSIIEHIWHFEVALYLIISSFFLQNILKIQVCFENSSEIILNEITNAYLKEPIGFQSG